MLREAARPTEATTPSEHRTTGSAPDALRTSPPDVVRPAASRHGAADPEQRNPGCQGCTLRDAALVAARAETARWRRRAELYLRYLPEQAGEVPEPPLRHRLADALNAALKATPGVHGRLKRALLSARASAARWRGRAP